MRFEIALLGLLVLRSTLDLFSSQGIPALFAIGLDALALIYVVVTFLLKRNIQVDRFWIFFAGWVCLQSLWVILLPFNILGFDESYLLIGLREWMRLFSWLMLYLLVTQLKGKVTPKEVLDILMLSLVMPILVSGMQILLPESMLPSFLVAKGQAYTNFDIAGASRISGTFGHPNAFATFLVFFFGLTLWQLEQSKRKLVWFSLLGVIIFLIVSAKALVGLVMLSVLIAYLVLSRLNIKSLVMGILVLSVTFVLFSSTPYGQERLQLILQLPYINPDIDASKAILLRLSSTNSFYWRVEQWTFLVDAWQQSPVWGYGFDTSRYLTRLNSAAHNDYVRALVETGVVGLISFLSFLLSMLFNNLKNAIERSKDNIPLSRLSMILVGVILAIMAGMLTENVWSHTALFFYVFAVTSVANWPTDLENDKV